MIKHVVGDLFEYVDSEERDVVIPHITNNIGAWGAGFVVPLGRRFPKAQMEYLNSKPTLGVNQWVNVENNGEKNIWVANMCSQHGITSKSTGGREHVNSKPIRYAALVDCMRNVHEGSKHIRENVIFAPKFGSGLAGGNWDLIEELIEEIWSDHEVTIFTLPEQANDEN